MNDSLQAGELCREWLNAKRLEDDAKQKRIEAEEALITLLGARDEGAQTHDVGQFKVTVTGVINRKLDAETYFGQVEAQLPEDLRPVRMEPKLDETGVKWLQSNRPDLYAIMARALTVKPGKTGVKVVEGKAKAA